MMVLPQRFRLLALFSAVVFLPAITYVTFQLSSMTAGLGLGLLICVVIANGVTIIKLQGAWILLWVGTLTVLFLHALLFTIYDINLDKFVSLLFVPVMLIGASAIGSTVEDVSSKEVRAFIKMWCAIAFVLGFLSPVLNVTILNYASFEKAVYPFSEPSHYVLNFSGFFLALGLMSDFSGRVILTSTVAALALVIESTLLIAVVCGFYPIFFARSVKLRQHIILFVVFVSAITALQGYDLSHFLERINFSDNNRNLSALVYLQGWQELWLALENTNWVGYGFQNMGASDPGSYANIVFSIWGDYKHRFDGSFLASKLIIEFGFAGVLAILVYMAFCIKSILSIWRFGGLASEARGTAVVRSDPRELLAHSMIIVFFFELFARSLGYFSFGIVALCFSIFLLYSRCAVRIRIWDLTERSITNALSARTASMSNIASRGQ